VAVTGSDTGSGFEQDPFLTIEKAITMVRAGETIFVKGGTYHLVNTIVMAKSGTNVSAISLFAFREKILYLIFQDNLWIQTTGVLN